MFKESFKKKGGKKINDLARIIENHAESYGYGVVHLVGHGVGYLALENLTSLTLQSARILRKCYFRRMVIAIEPMIIGHVAGKDSKEWLYL